VLDQLARRRRNQRCACGTEIGDRKEVDVARPQQILVPTDFSEAANAARSYATVLADAFGATLHVLHVIADALAMGWSVDAAHLPQLLERTEHNVREQLEATLTPDERSRLRVHLTVETGTPVARIIEYADKHGIDLIVMGTQGRGTVERMWVGSVTQGVLRRAPCPVVSVQQPRA
jgi:nucleotide-binding universal stress UspA family protein